MTNEKLFFEKHGIELAIFENGQSAIKIESPYLGDIGKGTTYYVRSVYGGYDLYTANGEKIDHVKSGSGNSARITAAIYNDTEQEEE